MQSDIQVNKSILGRFKSFQYSCKIELSPESFKSLFEICISQVAKLKSESRKLKNIKGLDQFNFAEELKYEQQLFSYTVSYENENHIKEQESFYLITPFDSFAGSDILHRVEPIASTELNLEIDSPLKRSELYLESLQLGMDFYGMTSFGNWFLKTPVVTESFFLKAGSDNKLEIKIMGENSPDRLNLSALLVGLFIDIKNLLNHDLVSDLEIKFKEKE